MSLATSLVLEFLAALFQSLLKGTDMFVDVFFSVLRLTEWSIKGIRKAGLFRSCIDTSLVEEDRLGQNGCGPDLLVALDSGTLDELLHEINMMK